MVGDYGDEPEPELQSEAFINIKDTIRANCSRCHNGSIQKAFDSERRWRSSDAQNRIRNEQMPPDKRMEPNDKKTLLDYFANN